MNILLFIKLMIWFGDPVGSLNGDIVASSLALPKEQKPRGRPQKIGGTGIATSFQHVIFPYLDDSSHKFQDSNAIHRGRFQPNFRHVEESW